MTEHEMLDYLLSTGLYAKGSDKRPYRYLYYEQQMMQTDKTLPISELVERFIELDKEYNGSPWNIKRILSNIDIIIPVEDRKQTGSLTQTNRRKYMSTKQNNSKSGIGFFSLLAIVFIVLKLIGIINWSWLWVLCPLWGQVVFWLVLGVIIYIGEVLKERKIKGHKM